MRLGSGIMACGRDMSEIKQAISEEHAQRRQSLVICSFDIGTCAQELSDYIFMTRAGWQVVRVSRCSQQKE